MGLKVTENTRREGGSSSRGTSGRKAKRTFIVRYDATTPPASVAAAETADDGTTAIPAVGDELPGDTTRTVTNVSAKPRDDTGLLFDVEVEYETPELGTFEEDPLTVPVDYDWDFGVGQKTYFKDETTPDPKYVTNSFGDPFDKLLQRDVGEIQVTITDNIDASAWDPVLAAEYLSPATATNAAPMTIDGISISAGQARITGITCSGIKTSNGVSYRTRTIKLKLKDSWDHDIDDRGFNELVDDGTGTEFPFPITTTDGQRVTKPWPLDGSGHSKDNATDPPEVLTFVPYPKKDFTVWGIT